jgi:hypothetical protein
MYEQPKTIVPQKLAAISKNPLPTFVRFSESDDEAADRFDSVRQADDRESSLLQPDTFEGEWNW